MLQAPPWASIADVAGPAKDAVLPVAAIGDEVVLLDIAIKFFDHQYRLLDWRTDREFELCREYGKVARRKEEHPHKTHAYQCQSESACKSCQRHRPMP